ncbi:PTS sugar transporter subunit IIB [Mycoplasma sp. Ms02]|uniref:PTS sugar transporter subunit IIB n=1 Tax=Mycoplasma sp. Ms02 TaxID=353851 RepID=UPI001C8AD037|nr:hypothetical protein [Mycoplasma sp. Ms02]QZE12311.1 hypothetical protein K4L35_03190 [Mycoplasma sp. Ms02]
MKWIIICSGGISSDILIKNLKRSAEDANKSFQSARAMSVFEFEDLNTVEADVILVAPQVRYMIDSIKTKAESFDKKVYEIEASEYSPLHSDSLFKKVVEEFY